MACTSRAASGAALLGYAVVATAFAWPLPLHLGSRLTGPVNSDTGVYVWNIWLFRHELVAHGRLPFFTGEILSLTPRVDLGLHNYTTFVNLLSLPVTPMLGVTATFNVVYLGMTVLSAWAMFLLARHVIGRAGEAWIAGLLFGFSAFMSARSTAHLSLLAAAPLPLFLLALLRTSEVPRPREAALLGLITAWAVMCDVYYGVYCLLIATCFFAHRMVRIRTGAREGSSRLLGWVRVMDVLLVCAAGLVVTILAMGGLEVRVGDLTIRMHTLYTPVLVITVLAILRGYLTRRPRLRLAMPRRPLRFATAAGIAAIACAALLAPKLYAVGWRLNDEGRLQDRIYWRSSPPGVDLVAMVLPNPSAAWFGAPFRAWLTARPNGFPENAVSLSLVGIGLLGFAFARLRFRPPRFWVFLTLTFGAIALGPFLTIGGLNTYVPGPWAILRYAPLVGLARTPARATVVLTLGFAVLVALALAHIVTRYPARRRLVLAGVAVALLIELAPFPRTLHSAEIPAIYRTIAGDPRDVSVLELPVGIRDGVTSVGSLSAAAQFYQTVHEKPLIGGYLSRISVHEIRRQRRFPVLRALMRMSEGKELSAARRAALKIRGDAFVERAKLGYVVVNRRRASPELEAFAVDLFGLERIGESDGRVLYRPRGRP
jgi:hypothetical protein